ncbi:MAG: DUF721 domain-containing protein [Kiritimatiellales bacterium]|nr:DUF721 domain-containing protein [Kiritimatiellales bacterium]
MKQRNRNQMNWQLTRERFHIADYRPPAPLRDEREIGAILSDILQTEPPAEQPPPMALVERWGLITGEQIAKHTAPSSLRNGVLSVYADHPGWLTEIRRLPKEHLLKKVMSIPGIPEITDIRFLLDPSIRTWKNRT